MIGISGGSQAIISYNYGAGEAKRVKRRWACTLKLMLAFTVLMFIISRFLPRVFVLLFTSVPEYMDFSVWASRRLP